VPFSKITILLLQPWPSCHFLLNHRQANGSGKKQKVAVEAAFCGDMDLPQ